MNELEKMLMNVIRRLSEKETATPEDVESLANVAEILLKMNHYSTDTVELDSTIQKATKLKELLQQVHDLAGSIGGKTIINN